MTTAESRPVIIKQEGQRLTKPVTFKIKKHLDILILDKIIFCIFFTFQFAQLIT